MKNNVNFYIGMQIWMITNNQIVSYVVSELPYTLKPLYTWSNKYFYIKAFSEKQKEEQINISFCKIYTNEIDCAKALNKSIKSKMNRRIKAIQKLEKDYSDIAANQVLLAQKYNL